MEEVIARLVTLNNLEFKEFDITLLTIRVVVTALMTLGNVEWLKNYASKKHGKRFWATVGMLVLLIHSIMQFPIIPWAITLMWYVIFLSNAFIHFAHAPIVKAPEMMMNKVFGVKDEARPKQ